MSGFVKLSKAVGWDIRHVVWPRSINEVINASDYKILEWYRFLPSPMNNKQIKLMDAIVWRFHALKDENHA